ncbi:MAG: hypothetical protein MJY99_12055 [Fibrobacter sp.]|nr:hypothetical protein [Fibrobacter sp.]
MHKEILKCASIVGTALTLFAACSDDPSVAGTAVEPNQNPIAYEESSSSMESPISSTTDSTATSSSSKTPLTSSSTKSSSSTAKQSSSSKVPLPTSSASVPLPSSSDIGAPSQPQSSSSIIDNGPTPQEPTNRLSDFVWQYKADIEFDENVLAYHLVGRDHCELGEICDDTPAIYEEFRHAGFYSEVDSDVIKYLFPKAENLISTRTKPLECPLRLLNVETRSNTGFVLTKISADTLTVVDLEISSSCDVSTEKKVFGILFMYCGEFSSNVVIEHKKPEKSTADVCVPEYETEWINWNLL